MDLNSFTTPIQVFSSLENLHSEHFGGTTAIGQGIKEAIKLADPLKGGRPEVAERILVGLTMLICTLTFRKFLDYIY